jgi:hypothetical protein
MAKRVILEAYAFDAAAKTITVNGKYLRQEQVILITNVTKSTVLYNFADANYSAKTWTTSTTNNVETTTIILADSTSTTGMLNGDKISILVEETNESFQPAEAQMDPVGKIRTSTTQALIDTDFEYGAQPSKWETIALAGNRPGFYYDSTLPIPVVSIQSASSSRVITVTLANGYSTTATCTANSNVITGLTAPTNGVYSVGMTVTYASGGGILVGAVVTQVISTSSVALSCYAGTGVAGSLTIALGYNLTTQNSLAYTNGYNPVYLQDTMAPVINGWQMPSTVTNVNTYNTQSFTFYARETFSSVQALYDPLKTYMFLGSSYTGSGIPLSVTAATAFTYSTNTITCTTVNAHGFNVGQSIMVTNTYATSNAPNGTWMIKSVPTSNTFVFDVVNTPTGNIACGTTINGTTAATTPASATVVITAVNAAGQMTAVSVGTAGTNYQIGDILLVATGAGGYVKVLSITAAGAVTAFGIYHPGTSGYTVSTQATTYTYTSNSLFIKPWAGAIHRPFDGGVQFGAGLPYHGNQLIRQTRRYFRYQSGKGIQFSTGSNFCSVLTIDSITASGTDITVTTKYSHNLGVGTAIKVDGATDPNYNGTGTLGGSTFVVTTILSDTSFKYTAAIAPSSTPAVSTTSTILSVQPVKWYGGSVRVGMFDVQNGFFFQYDGQFISAVRRSSTQQLSGYISQLGQGGQVCTGVGTSWSTQLAPGNFIVIRGQSHIVVSIESNTSMTISPDYRGSAIVAPSNAVVSKTIDTKFAQSNWNIDKCDGSGSSGFNLDITKMQMWVIDYSWYGAGAIRFGFKNQRGEIMFAHRIAHGNGQTEAYMRSGNLPARYEVNTWWPTTTLAATISAGATSLTVADASGFPAANSVLCIQASGNTGAGVEYVKYTTLTGNTFSGLTRGCTVASNPVSGPGLAAAGGGAAAGYTVNTPNTAPTMVSLFMPTAASTISHWGSSVMMDGRYDDDKSFLFNYGTATPVTFAASVAGVRFPVFSIRLAPSVDNGFTNVLGYREIVNRMQLSLASCGVFVTGSGVKVELFLNAKVTSATGTGIGVFTPVGGSSLAQFATHGTAGSMVGGECIYTFFAPANGVSTQDLTKMRDAGTSIQGGGTHLNCPVFASNMYPDGPDVITVAITALTGTAAVVAARINWAEAQA